MTPIDKRVNKILELLDKGYPEPRLELNFKTPLELLIATILAAQCTDVRVNAVTKDLFKKYKKAEDYAKADINVLEEEIRPTGFYKNKAKSIINCCKMIVEKFKGEVPRTLEELTGLPGVGRKTANVVLGIAYGIPAIAVDTHMTRVSYRLGLTEEADADKIEVDLMRVIPQERWIRFTMQMVLHGRYVCIARRPKCSTCVLNSVCPKKGVTVHD